MENMEKQDAEEGVCLEEILKDLKKARYDYLEEIPKEIKHSFEIVEDKIITPNYKCRNGWFTIILGYGDFLINQGKIKDPELIKHYDSFEKYFREEKLFERRKTSEDIKRGNELLDRLIPYVENEILQNKKPNTH